MARKFEKRCDPADFQSAKERAPRETRPCVIVSPDEMNKYIRTVIIAPMTTKIRGYKSRIHVEFNNKQAQVMLDQLRTIDKQRLIKKLGNLSRKEMKQVLHLLQEMFTY